MSYDSQHSPYLTYSGFQFLSFRQWDDKGTGGGDVDGMGRVADCVYISFNYTCIGDVLYLRDPYCLQT